MIDGERDMRGRRRRIESLGALRNPRLVKRTGLAEGDVNCQITDFTKTGTAIRKSLRTQVQIAVWLASISTTPEMMLLRPCRGDGRITGNTEVSIKSSHASWFSSWLPGPAQEPQQTTLNKSYLESFPFAASEVFPAGSAPSMETFSALISSRRRLKALMEALAIHTRANSAMTKPCHPW